MKIYRVAGYGYTSNVRACDRQHARVKFLNSLNKSTKSENTLTQSGTSIVRESEVDSSYLTRFNA